MARPSVTASHIARHLGLAQSTVSHVLNGRADELRIRAETQQRVREAASELGYRPNASARAMRSGRFNSAALIQSTHRVYVPASLLLGLTQELNRRGMRLMVAESPEAEIGEAVYLPNVMRELSVDGLLVNVLQDVPPELLAKIHELRVPAVWINTDGPADCVHPDDFNAAVSATKYLLKLGHTRIAWARSEAPEPEVRSHYSVAARREGYKSAMERARLRSQFLKIGQAPNWFEGRLHDERIADAVRILGSPERPTAIMAYEADTALPFLLAALQMGLQVPRDLSLLMFHHDFDTSIGISITAMIHDMGRIGAQAAALLEEKINEPEAPLPPRAVPSKLFEGSTCAAPP